MSIILGPFERNGRAENEQNDEDFLVFGYSCKLYRDDAKALLEDSGALLIPWMGDSSLMIDRYDVRNRLDDKNQFGLKPNIPHRVTVEEEQLEDTLDKERYLALGCDILEEQLQEEEEEKRKQELLLGSNSFHAVGYSYVEEEYHEDGNDTSQFIHEPVTTAAVDIGEDNFIFPPGLVVPPDIKMPVTNKLHSIIEKTAQFVSQQGQQMEIIIKTKQKFNPYFCFLDHDDVLNPYYKHLLQSISTKAYQPKIHSQADDTINQSLPSGSQEQSQQQDNVITVTDGGSNDDSEELGDSDDEDSYELHPLLRGARTSMSQKKVQEATMNSKDNGHTGIFYAKTMAINLAPAVSTESQTRGDQSTRVGISKHSSSPVQHHGSGDLQGQLAQTGQYYSDDPYNAYCYQMQLAEYQYNLQAYYQAMSSQGIIGNGPTPPPPDIQPIVDKTAEYVAKNDEGFERTVLDKHCDDPKFAFLNPWNHYHAYYQMKKDEYRRKRRLEELEKENALSKPNVQRLSSNGAVSFKLATKSCKPLVSKVDLNAADSEDIAELEGNEEGCASEGEPAPKKPRCTSEEEEKMDSKVQEFLSRVKRMFGTD